MRKIVTEHVYPPIPWRHFDWSAVYSDYEPGDPIGTGATEAEAVADLLLIVAEDLAVRAQRQAFLETLNSHNAQRPFSHYYTEFSL